MLPLTLRWRMRRSVKKCSINVATLQAGFMASPPTADRDAAPLLPSTRGRPRDTSRYHARRRGRGKWRALGVAARRPCLRDTSRAASGWRSDDGSRARVARYDHLGAAARSLGTIARRRDERTGAASGLPVRQRRRSSRSVIRASRRAGGRSRAARFSSSDAMAGAATCRTWSAGPSDVITLQAHRLGYTHARHRDQPEQGMVGPTTQPVRRRQS